MPVINIRTQQDFDNLVATDGVVLLDFWAPTCGPCRVMGKILDIVAKERGTVIGKIDINDHPEVLKPFKVETIPTIIALRRKEEIQRWYGVVMPEKLRVWLSEWEGPTVAAEAPTEVIRPMAEAPKQRGWLSRMIPRWLASV